MPTLTPPAALCAFVADSTRARRERRRPSLAKIASRRRPPLLITLGSLDRPFAARFARRLYIVIEYS